jgi:hypothetical protein
MASDTAKAFQSGFANGSLQKVASVYYPYSMPYEHFDIFYCRGLRQSLKEIWPRVKNWD